MKPFTYIYCLFRVLFTPACWLQNSELSRSWDKALLDSINAGHKFELVHGAAYEVTINGYTVWVENHPYASFTIKKPGEKHIYVSEAYMRPSRMTILYAWDTLLKQIPDVPKLQNRRPRL